MIHQSSPLWAGRGGNKAGHTHVLVGQSPGFVHHIGVGSQVVFTKQGICCRHVCRLQRHLAGVGFREMVGHTIPANPAASNLQAMTCKTLYPADRWQAEVFLCPMEVSIVHPDVTVWQGYAGHQPSRSTAPSFYWRDAQQLAPARMAEITQIWAW
jgi:hypothetical protein